MFKLKSKKSSWTQSSYIFWHSMMFNFLSTSLHF